MTQRLRDILDEICNAMDDGYLIPFLGAGASRPSSLPTYISIPLVLWPGDHCASTGGVRVCNTTDADTTGSENSSVSHLACFAQPMHGDLATEICPPIAIGSVLACFAQPMHGDLTTEICPPIAVGSVTKAICDDIATTVMNTPHREPHTILAASLVASRSPEGLDPFLEECTKHDHLQGRLKSLGLAKLSELFLQSGDERDLCSLLRIPDYKDLQPTQAHRYVMWLMREGAIREVITTNYDTCLERAWFESRGAPYPDDYPLQMGNSHDHDGVQVVTDAEEYAGICAQGNEPGRIYKINGCAQRYVCRKETVEEARRIILTERQLQTFRGEEWAREMFRDRARQSKFVFSGFGSEEPQIRHTMLALVDEIASYAHGDCVLSESEDEDKDPEAHWQLRTAPIINAYSTHLTFNQHQMLYAWWEVWERRAARVSKREVRRYSSGQLRNGITGQDAQWFGAQEDKLPADLFWEGIFQNWWRRWLCKLWEESGLAKEIAARSGIDARAVVRLATEGIEAWFRPRNGPTSVRWTCHLHDGGGHLPFMSRLVAAEGGPQRYVPIHVSGEAIAMLALLLSATKTPCTSGQMTSDDGDPPHFVEPLVTVAGARIQLGTSSDLPMHAHVLFAALPTSGRDASTSTELGKTRARMSKSLTTMWRGNDKLSVHEGQQVDAIALLTKALKRRPTDWEGWQESIVSTLRERETEGRSASWRTSVGMREIT